MPESAIQPPVQTAAEEASAPVRELTRAQARVLGVLVEKAFTTPEYYPLTLKAIAAGCNQKSNRSPITNYGADAVEETLEELRNLGLVAEVHTESGRTARYRHYMRKRYPFSEAQLAIVTELLLRGRQQLGELRSRASRMVAIEGLDQLREELHGLQEGGWVTSSGPLERRGVEVDHGFYPAGEGPRWEPGEEEVRSQRSARATSSSVAPSESHVTASVSSDRLAVVERTCAELRSQLSDVLQEVQSLKDQLTDVSEGLSRLERDLGA